MTLETAYIHVPTTGVPLRRWRWGVVATLSLAAVVLLTVGHRPIGTGSKSLLHESALIEACPGDTRGDYKCNHDETHRVCAKLMDEHTGKPLSWGPGDFWEITGQKPFEWSADILSEPNPGDSWCVCMWATKALIEKVGCENVSLRCEATDVAFVLDSYEDGGEELSAAHACLKEKCSAPVAAAALNPSLKTTSLGFLTADGLEPVDLTATANSLLAQLTDGVQAANATLGITDTTSFHMFATNRTESCHVHPGATVATVLWGQGQMYSTHRPVLPMPTGSVYYASPFEPHAFGHMGSQTVVVTVAWSPPWNATFTIPAKGCVGL